MCIGGVLLRPAQLTSYQTKRDHQSHKGGIVLQDAKEDFKNRKFVKNLIAYNASLVGKQSFWWVASGGGLVELNVYLVLV